MYNESYRYQKWHTYQHHHRFHWLIFGLAIIIASAVIISAWQVNIDQQDQLTLNLAQVAAQSPVIPSLPMPSSGDTYQISTSNYVGRPSPANLDNDQYLDWIIEGYTDSDPEEVEVIIEARDYDGNLLWEHKTGRNVSYTIDRTNRHEFYIVWNMKQDTPEDEVIYIVLTYAGLEIRMLDGRTGEILEQRPFSSSGDGRRYGAIMYWNGKPYVVVAQSVTQNGRVTAFDENLNEVWRFDMPDDWSGTGHHGLNTYDLDGDGDEEVLYGGTTLDSNGELFWSLSEMFGYAHVDSVNVGDLIPGNGTKEIYYALEYNHAVLMLDQNGQLLWRWIDPCGHPGGLTGRCYDFDSDYPGAECVVNYDDCDDNPCGECEQDKILSAYDGEVIRNAVYNEKRTRWPEWTGDDVYDVGGAPDYRGGRSYGADLGGGANHGAEEVVETRFPGDNLSREITVHFNRNANDYPSRWQNRHYRQDVMRVLSGYTIDNDTFQVYELGGITPPPPKNGDLNNDGKVDVIDLGILLSNWGPSTGSGQADLNQDGRVDVIDLGIMLSNWG